jgi:predicted Zn-dependent protease
VQTLVIAFMLFGAAFAQETASGNAGAQGEGSSSPTEQAAARQSSPSVAPLPSASGQEIKTRGRYDVSRIGDRGIGGGLNLYSLERERELGKVLASQVESEARLLSDPVVTEYVNRVAQEIVRNSDARLPFTVKMIDDDSINAFALPGGYLYVNTGLLLAAENEAELAGVIAHEVAHVAARHATKNATRAQIFNLASIPLIFFGGPAGMVVRQVAGLAIPMSFLKFSRDAEREADLLGIEYEYSAGYDPGEFVHFFETIKSREGGKQNILAKAFATHPMTGDRIKRAQKEIETMLPAKDQYVVNTSEFDEVKARLASMENKLQLRTGRAEEPTLRRRSQTPSDGGGDERPTLKRH